MKSGRVAWFTKSHAVMDGLFLHRMEYQRTIQGISAPPQPSKIFPSMAHWFEPAAHSLDKR
jgi:hypothetical protein